MRNMRPWTWVVAAGLLAVQVVLVAVIVHGESLTIDEGDHIFAGYMMWHSKDFGLNPEHPPLVKLVATLPLLGRSLWVPPMQNRMFKVEAYYGGRDFLEHNDGPGQRLVFQMRLAAGVFAVGLSLFVFLAGLEWFRWGAALLALALMVFEPNLLANSDLVTTDIGVACFLVGGGLCFWRYARRPTLARMLLAGLAAGCALAAFPVEMAYSNEAWGGPSNVHKYLSDANVEWGQQLLAEQIDHGVFVYRGEFPLPEVAALSSTNGRSFCWGRARRRRRSRRRRRPYGWSRGAFWRRLRWEMRRQRSARRNWPGMLTRPRWSRHTRWNLMSSRSLCRTWSTNSRRWIREDVNPLYFPPEA